jgi:CubicO group peptidase (beta-lactamase class C family)
VPAVAPAGQLVVDSGGSRVLDLAMGSAIDNDGEVISPETLFDLASLTKVFSALALMRLVESRFVGLDDAITRVLPDFAHGSAMAAAVTWRHLLAHTSGLPAGADLTSASDPAEAHDRALAVRPATAPGSAVLYSDVGYMVLGFGVEAVSGRRLDEAIRALVTGPAALDSVSYHPEPKRSIAPTEFDAARGRHLRGEVHDENAAALGGIAGHAGLFGTARDLAKLGDLLLEDGSPTLDRSSLREMTREQAAKGVMRRGLGFSLWSPDPEATSHPLGPRTFGHTGFTGTSLWVDPDRRLVVALLTNAVYRGRDFEAFFAARIRAHREIIGIADRAPRPSLEERR